MKKKGFSIVEIVLVLGVIGILATFLVPKTRVYLAMAKDNKMISSLNGIRMASETYYLENGKEFFLDDGNIAISQIELDKLKNYLNESLKLTGDNLLLEIGGSKTDADEIKYGGDVEVYINNNNEIKIRATSAVGPKNIKGELWEEM